MPIRFRTPITMLNPINGSDLPSPANASIFLLLEILSIPMSDRNSSELDMV